MVLRHTYIPRPNTYKQTQVGYQNEETKQHGPNKRTDQNYRKRIRHNGDEQSIRCRIQNTVIRMLKELSEELSSIKRIQSVYKGTLIEIKTNVQVNNSRVDEAKNHFIGLEPKEAKSDQSEQ